MELAWCGTVRPNSPLLSITQTFINVNGQGYEGVENRGEIKGGQVILEGLGEAFEQNVKQGRGVQVALSSQCVKLDGVILHLPVSLL